MWRDTSTSPSIPSPLIVASKNWPRRPENLAHSGWLPPTPRIIKPLKLLADQPQIAVSAGPEALVEAAGDEHCAVVMTAIVGAAGLAPTLAAVQAGKRVGIANKEPLVMAGSLIMATARDSGATLLPVDSEHSAIFQCLENHQESDIDRLILTASGGPFRTIKDLSQVTFAQALKHPNWNMAPRSPSIPPAS